MGEIVNLSQIECTVNYSYNTLYERCKSEVVC